MDFWNKMLLNIADIVLPQDLDDDVLLLQIKEALQEEAGLWHSKQGFLDPCVIKSFQGKWYPAYCSAKKRTGGILFSIGLSGRKIRELAPQFIKTYERLHAEMQMHNDRLAGQKAADAAKLILPVEGKILDDQQMRCITKDVRNHLVLAGAGARVILQTGRKTAYNKAISGLSFLRAGRRARVNVAKYEREGVVYGRREALSC